MRFAVNSLDYDLFFLCTFVFVCWKKSNMEVSSHEQWKVGTGANNYVQINEIVALRGKMPQAVVGKKFGIEQTEVSAIQRLQRAKTAGLLDDHEKKVSFFYAGFFVVFVTCFSFCMREGLAGCVFT
jgi:hypothetical protein